MKRRIIEDLRPSALDNLGLVPALEILAREFAEQSGVEVHAALEPVELKADAELVVFRLVQEAVTNIAKYAKAQHVWVSLTMEARRCRSRCATTAPALTPRQDRQQGTAWRGCAFASRPRAVA